uniref:Uncharacterized protein n=1 Tax=uncultured Thiotrichaceae bacterium TaxID=298394 RepID=A0A6S6S6D4_9GAMM|nr:MAG: Unknown protein [uncultured Thiotrichaceae bacterium]
MLQELMEFLRCQHLKLMGCIADIKALLQQILEALLSLGEPDESEPTPNVVLTFVKEACIIVDGADKGIIGYMYVTWDTINQKVLGRVWLDSDGVIVSGDIVQGKYCDCQLDCECTETSEEPKKT